jgi:hypothetical protein
LRCEDREEEGGRGGRRRQDEVPPPSLRYEDRERRREGKGRRRQDDEVPPPSFQGSRREEREETKRRDEESRDEKGGSSPFTTELPPLQKLPCPILGQRRSLRHEDPPVLHRGVVKFGKVTCCYF